MEGSLQDTIRALLAQGYVLWPYKFAGYLPADDGSSFSLSQG
jgi:hypothetical protein